MNKVAIELLNIEFSHYEQRILDGINLKVEEGEFVVLVGPNGSGKSTLLKMINGVISPNSGSVIVDGKAQTGKPVHELARLVSTLTQDLNNSTFSDLTVWENIQLAIHRKYLGVARVNILNKSELIKYLDGFNPSLSARLNVLTSRLSGGQRQALALAMCFAHAPYLLLLDEHTSALDPKAAAVLMGLTNDHVCEKNLTTVMVTHNLDHALQFGTRLIAVNQGRIIADLSGPKKTNITKNDLIEMVY